MKNTMKTFEATNLYEALSTLVSDKERKIPGDIAWNILRVFRQVEPIKRDFDEIHQNKFKSMRDEGKAIEVTDEDGKSMLRITDEHLPEFVTYMNEVAATEVDIEFYTISQESFDKLLNTCNLTIPEIQVIEKMIEKE